MTEGDRRASTRYHACIAAHVAMHDGQNTHINVIRDLSVSGAQLLSRLHPTLGTALDLRLYIHHDRPEEAQDVIAKVVRVDRREGDATWPYVVAVQFEKALEGFDLEIAEIAARQAEIYRDIK